MKKKILIFNLAYYPQYVGGAEVAIKEITDRLLEYDFYLVCLRFDSSQPRVEKIGNVEVHRIGWSDWQPSPKVLRSFRYRLLKLWFQFAAAWRAQLLHKTLRFDATWSMMAHSSGVPGALFKMKHPQVPFVLTLQEGDPIPQIERTMMPLWPLFIRAFTKADIIQCISTYLGKWARARGFKGRLEIIPNGVDTAKFIGDPILHEGVVLITTSRLVDKNGIDTIIRALPLLPDNTRLEILGSGPNEELLKQLATQLNVSDRVAFNAFVPHEQLVKHLHSADIFIRPSRSEGMGNSFIEAFAAGLPVIATQEGGIADFLFDAKKNPEKPTTGWAVDVDSPEQIAHAVEDILGNPVKAAAVILEAGKLAANRYDWSRIATEMKENVFEPVLKR